MWCEKEKENPNIHINLFFFSFLLFLTQSRGQKKKWERFELEGVKPHQCVVKKKEEESVGIPTTNTTTVTDNGQEIRYYIRVLFRSFPDPTYDFVNCQVHNHIWSNLAY